MAQLNLRNVQNKYIKLSLTPKSNILTELSVKLCVKEKRNSSSQAWNYYGMMYDSNDKVYQQDRYYCQPCLVYQQQLLKAGKAAHPSKIHNIATSTSSGNAKIHLMKVHNIDIDCDVKKKRKKYITQLVFLFKGYVCKI